MIEGAERRQRTLVGFPGASHVLSKLPFRTTPRCPVVLPVVRQVQQIHGPSNLPLASAPRNPGRASRFKVQERVLHGLHIGLHLVFSQNCNAENVVTAEYTCFVA